MWLVIAEIVAIPIDGFTSEGIHLAGKYQIRYRLLYSFETSDGQTREESAVLNNAGSENESLSVKGSYSFVADDGQTYTVRIFFFNLQKILCQLI